MKPGLTRMRAIAIPLLLGLVLLSLPAWTGTYATTLVELWVAQGIAVLGLHLLVGETGLISLGHAGFMAVGAYGTAALTEAGLSPLLALLLAAMIAAGLGYLFSLPANRLRGPYLAIATLAFGLAMTVLIATIPGWGGRTGRAVLLPWGGGNGLYYTVLLIGFLCWTWVQFLHQSRIGRIFRGIRDDALAAESVGIATRRYQHLSFTLSAALAGIAGGIWAWYLGYINPELFGFNLSVMLLAALVLGGLGSVNGALIGAFLMGWMEQQFVPTGAASRTWLISGAVLILVMVLEPRGLVGLWKRIVQKWA